MNVGQLIPLAIKFTVEGDARHGPNDQLGTLTVKVQQQTKPIRGRTDLVKSPWPDSY